MTQAAIPLIEISDDQESIARATIGEISHIATLPEVTLKVIRLVEDPDSTAQDLNQIINNDPALGTRILKVVNSSFYGLPGQIGSINRAIVLLGLNGLKNVAIAASLAKLFRGGRICDGFNARVLWTHSLGVASGTRILAAKSGLGLPDEAFLAGLIHDLGIMVAMQTRRQSLIEAIETLEDNPGMTFRQAEEAALGITHEHLGLVLCRAWKFPACFWSVSGFHHRPLEAPEEHQVLTALVHIADVLAARVGVGYTRTVEHEQVADELLGLTGITRQQLEETVEELPGAVEEAATLLQA